MKLTSLGVLQSISLISALATSSLSLAQVKKPKVQGLFKFEATEVKTGKNKTFFKLTFPAKQPFFETADSDQNKFILSFTTMEDKGEMLYTASGLELKAYDSETETLVPLEKIEINLSPKAESLFIVRREGGIITSLELDENGEPTSGDFTETVCKIVKLKITPVNQNGKVVKVIGQTTKLDALDKFKVKHPRPASPLAGCSKLSFY